MDISKIQKAVTQRQNDKKSLLNLSFPDFTYFPHLLEDRRIQTAFINIFRYPYYYPSPKGDIEARVIISKYYQRRKLEIDPEHILLTASIAESYSYIFKAIANMGGDILCPLPRAPYLDEAASFIDLKLKDYQLSPTSSWDIDFKSMKITNRTKAILLQNPHLPTGKIIQEKDLKELLSLCKKHDLILILDESLSDLVFHHKQLNSALETASKTQSIISINSLQYAFALPGFKISWLTFHGKDKQRSELMNEIEYLADTFLNVSQLPMTVLPEVIKYSRKFRKKMRLRLEKNLSTTIAKLSKSKKLSFTPAQGGVSLMVELKHKKLNLEDFILRLISEQGVYLHPCDYYNYPGNYFVISFLQDPQTLRKGLTKLLQFLKA